MNAPQQRAKDQAMWVVGALERLACLGYIIAASVPYLLRKDDLEHFTKIDADRHNLFSTDEDMFSIVREIIGLTVETYDDDTEAVCLLVKDYRDNRTHLVASALERSFS